MDENNENKETTLTEQQLLYNNKANKKTNNTCLNKNCAKQRECCTDNGGLEKELNNKALMYVLRDGLSPRYGLIHHHKPVYQSDPSVYRFDPYYNSDEYYMLELYNILNVSNCLYFNMSPAPVTDYMYIGGYKEAKDWKNLRKLGITHVLNLAAFWEDNSYNPYPVESGVVAYEAYNAQDNEDYNVMQHYPSVRSFIDRARWTGGKVLVHCAMGINRSGTICCAYLMDGHKMTLIEAVKRLKQQRGTVLRNRGFQKQLLHFAREHGFL